MAEYKAPVEIIELYNLDLYLFDSDPEFKSATEVMMVMHHPDWTRPKRAALSDVGTGGGSAEAVHREADILSNLSSANISETFNVAFTQIPVGRKNLYCYRVDEGYDSNLLLKDIIILTTGFTCTIEDVSGDPITDFTGIVFEYSFEERT